MKFIVLVVVCDVRRGGNVGDSDAGICGGGMVEVVCITTAHALPWEMSVSKVSPCWEL